MRKSKLIIFLTMLMSLCLLCFVGCSSGDGGGEGAGQPTKTITLSQTSVTATVFEDVSLTAQTENISEKIVWSVSNTSIATVDNGLVRAKKAGIVTVTATAEDVSATAQITFTTVDSSRLVLESECVELEIYVGDEVSVDAYVKLDGNVVDGGNFDLSVSNPEVLEITSDGKVKALEVGQANVLINGVIKGITLDEISVPVTVTVGEELSTGAENDTVTIYISEGAKKEFRTSYTLAPVVKIRNEIVDSATFDYELADNNVISLDDGVITAKQIGATTIDIIYEGTNGTLTKTLVVNVVKPSTKILEDEQVLIGVNTENDLSIFGIDAEILEISVNGQASEVSVSGNKFSFKTAVQSGLKADVIIKTEKEDFLLTANVYDFIADTKEEFKAFGIATKTNPNVSIALSSNINYEMGNFFTDCGFNVSSTFSGLFDGMGYTVYNIKGNNGLFAVFKNATLKNVAFFNLVRDTYNGGGSIVNTMEKDSTNTIENVYVQVKFTAYTGTDLAGFANIGNGYFSNVVVHADFASNPGVYNAFCKSFYAGQEPSLENCYVISSNSSGKMYSDVEKGLYVDAESFNKDVDATLFNENYWEVANGALVFKTAKDLILSAYPTESAINITNTETEFNGSLIKINTSITNNVSIFLKNEYPGLAIEDGCLVAKNSCSAGNVTVVAKWQHPILGYTLSTEKTFAVKEVQFTSEQTTVMVAKNRTEDFSYDLSKYNLSSIQSVEFNNKNVVFSFNNNSLVIERNELDSAIAELKITAFTSTACYVIGIPVESVDYAIGTKAELQAFGKAIITDTDAIAILTASVDYENGNFFTDSAFWGGAPSYTGSLDGKGYAIYNVKAKNGLFANLDSVTIKNIAFYNVLRETKDVGGTLANVMTGANVLENVYIQVAFTNTSASSIAGVANICEGTFTNVILDVDFSGVPNTYNAWGNSCNVNKAPTLNNCYVISTNSNGNLFGTLIVEKNPVINNSKLYTSKDAFTTDSASLKANFSDEYWKLDSNGTLVFKNAVA